MGGGGKQIFRHVRYINYYPALNCQNELPIENRKITRQKNYEQIFRDFIAVAKEVFPSPDQKIKKKERN